MSARSLVVSLALAFVWQSMSFADNPVFSGPQAGEKLPPFKAQGVFGDQAGKEVDLIGQADGKPLLLVFVHRRTRPAFGLTNTVMKYAATQKEKGLTSGVIFLTADPTETGQWMNRVKQHFPDGVTHAISTDGVDGPGAYGLNRNVTLTVLVGNEGKVTANFALVQPSLPTDGPKILKAIVDATGGGEVPSIADLAGPRYRGQREGGREEMRREQRNDPELGPLLRAVINKQASAEEVAEAAKVVEAYVKENDTARSQLGRIANTVVNSGRLTNYGTEAAQEQLKQWAKEFGPQQGEREANDDEGSDKE